MLTLFMNQALDDFYAALHRVEFLHVEITRLSLFEYFEERVVRPLHVMEIEGSLQCLVNLVAVRVDDVLDQVNVLWEFLQLTDVVGHFGFNQLLTFID